MKEPRPQKVDRVKVSEVLVVHRMRPVSEAGVESLVASITELGVMKDPIHVRRRRDGKLVLIAGGHRLEAARRLGWEDIPATVWADVTDAWARLMEIDDNLAGAEMGALDTAIFLAARKRIYEDLHPETKRGGDRRSSAFQDQTDIVSFCSATAEKFGLSDRHVRRMVAAGEKLDARDVQLLRKAPRQLTLRDLQELGRIAGPAERYSVVEDLSEGRVKSAGEARKLYQRREAGDPVTARDPHDEAFKALARAWDRASKVARRRFVADREAEIMQLIDGREPEEAIQVASFRRAARS